jgi:ABC-type multidrug transport system fused ATPase/permease subunit
VRRESVLHLEEEQEAQPRAEPEPARNLRSSFLRLLGYSLGHHWLLLLGTGGMLVNGLGTIVLPYLCGDIIDSINRKDPLLPHMVQFALLTVFLFVFGGLRGFCFNLLGEEVMLELRVQLFEALVRKDIHFYDVNKSGDLISRLASDISVVQSAASDNLSILMRNVLQFIGSLILLWLISWRMTLVVLALVPIVSVSILLLGTKLKTVKKSYQDKLAFANTLATEVFGNIRTVRAFACEAKEALEFSTRMKEVYRFGRVSSLIYAGFLVMVTILGNGIIMVVLWYGGYLVANGQLTIGQLTSYVLYAITLSINLTSVTSSINEFVTAAGVIETIFKLIDTPVRVEPGPRPFDPAQPCAIDMQAVTFEYPEKPNVPIVRDLTLHIRSGESLAIVGSSGAGKSTIVGMLERFYDIKAGSILIDGVPLKEYDLFQLRKSIGLVSQEPVLFSGSLYDNISYACQIPPSEEAIREVLAKSNADEFVMNKGTFPEGLQTVVGERGVKLSGGQKQRIAIARALITNPKILIFDEATSALDSISESQVQASIAKVMELKERTVIVIAHRLSTIRNCDRIVVLKDGRVCEEGTHKDLVELRGEYYKMVFKQL